MRYEKANIFLLYTMPSDSESGWYGFGKPQYKCGDSENRITLCRINSIKKRKLMGTVQYIIKAVIDFINN